MWSHKDEEHCSTGMVNWCPKYDLLRPCIRKYNKVVIAKEGKVDHCFINSKRQETFQLGCREYDRDKVGKGFLEFDCMKYCRIFSGVQSWKKI